MRKPILLPDLGAAAAILSVWFVDPGDQVYAGDRIVEVLMDGATFDVSSPVTGTFAERLALPDDPLSPGQSLGTVEESPV
jgi:pyruvate/2-oxoglutarate dehydrogenase complex dihydrolipoamide acyltransferase (E2) component